MTRLHVLRGGRLLPRLYLFEAVLFTAIFLAFAGIGRFVVEPGIRSEVAANLAWVGNEILTSAAEPARLQRQLESLGRHTAQSAALFDRDGRVLATGGVERLVPLDAAQFDSLMRQSQLVLSDRSVAVTNTRVGNPSNYVIVAMPTHRSLLHAGIIYGVILLALAIASVPLARWIARPLERLAAVTQAFGLGNLRVRADPNRHDEFGDLARAFNTMADRVEQLRRTEKELLANVSHELRTPLARIRVVLELAQDEVPQVAQQYLTDISEDLTELEQILTDIIASVKLDFAAEEQQGPYPPLQRTPLRVSEFVDTLIAKFRRQHPQRRVDLHVDGDATIMADRVMLAHAFGNVLDNAQKYSTAPRPIEVAVCVDLQSFTLTITDQGVGIGAEDLPKIFTPFFRADPSRTRGTGGVGLGLTLAKRLIEAHNGSITIESKLGEGTQVSMRFTASN